MGLADALIARIDKLIRDRLDAAISSRLAASSYVAPDNANIGLIKAKTDLIPGAGIPSITNYSTARADLIDRLDAAITSRLASADFIAPDNSTIAAIYALLDTEIAAIINKVNLIPASGPPSVTDYSASRALKLDNLDALISSRLAAGSYVAPPSAADIWAAATRTLTAAPSVIKSRQEGYLSAAATTAGSGEDNKYKDVAISAVDPAKALIGVSACDLTVWAVRLTSSTNLRFGTAGGANSVTARWVVIEFA